MYMRLEYRPAPTTMLASLLPQEINLYRLCVSGAGPTGAEVDKL